MKQKKKYISLFSFLVIPLISLPVTAAITACSDKNDETWFEFKDGLVLYNAYAQQLSFELHFTDNMPDEVDHDEFTLLNLPPNAAPNSIMVSEIVKYDHFFRCTINVYRPITFDGTYCRPVLQYKSSSVRMGEGLYLVNPPEFNITSEDYDANVGISTESGSNSCEFNITSILNAFAFERHWGWQVGLDSCYQFLPDYKTGALKIVNDNKDEFDLESLDNISYSCKYGPTTKYGIVWFNNSRGRKIVPYSRFSESNNIINSFNRNGLDGYDTLVIPNNVTAIASSSAAGVFSSLPESITLVNFNSLSACTTVGENAFLNDTHIQKVVFSKNINTIYNDAFKGCSALSTIYFLGETPPQIYDDSFSNVQGRKVYVPALYVDTYQDNAIFLDHLHIGEGDVEPIQ